MNAEITMLPVAAGDATLLQCNDGHHRYSVLIDAGLRTREVATYLNSIGVEHLDLVILSHPDMDHLGGLPAIMNDPSISVSRIWCFDLAFLREFVRTGVIPPPRPATHEVVYCYHLRSTLDEFSGILTTATGQNVQILQVSEGYRLSLGPMLLEVMYPPQSLYDALHSPAALRTLLTRRKLPEDWDDNRDREGRPKARPVEPHDQEGRLAEEMERPDMPEEGVLMGRLAPSGEGEERGESDTDEGLSWRMVGTLYNNLSIVVKVSILGGIEGPTALFPGDLTDWTTILMRQWGNLQADILKLPHHGSHHVSCDFRDMVREFEHCYLCHRLCEHRCPHGPPWPHPMPCRDWHRWWRRWRASSGRELIHEVVAHSSALVFPYPRYDLPDEKGLRSHARIIANRVDRSLPALKQRRNAPCAARLSLGLEKYEITEESA